MSKANFHGLALVMDMEACGLDLDRLFWSQSSLKLNSPPVSVLIQTQTLNFVCLSNQTHLVEVISSLLKT